jgi:hypothetical protein
MVSSFNLNDNKLNVKFNLVTMLMNTILSELLVNSIRSWQWTFFFWCKFSHCCKNCEVFSQIQLNIVFERESYSKAELEYSFDYVENNNLNSQKTNCGYGISMAKNDSWQAPSPWLAMLMPSPMNIVFIHN